MVCVSSFLFLSRHIIPYHSFRIIFLRFRHHDSRVHVSRYGCTHTLSAQRSHSQPAHHTCTRLTGSAHRLSVKLSRHEITRCGREYRKLYRSVSVSSTCISSHVTPLEAKDHALPDGLSSQRAAATKKLLSPKITRGGQAPSALAPSCPKQGRSPPPC